MNRAMPPRYRVCCNKHTEERDYFTLGYGIDRAKELCAHFKVKVLVVDEEADKIVYVAYPGGD